MKVRAKSWGPDVEGFVGEVRFHAHQVSLVVGGFDLAVQSGPQRRGEVSLEPVVAAAVVRRCPLALIRGSVGVMPC